MRTSGNKMTLIENKNTPAEVARNKKEEETQKKTIYCIVSYLWDMTPEELREIEDTIASVKCRRFNLLRYQYQLSEKQNAIN